MQEFQPASERVTPLFGPSGNMQDPVLLDLLKYWEHLRAGRIAPLRSEIDPREIRGALDYTFILEQTKLGEVRFRLAGNRLCDLLGMELRGMPAYSLIETESRDRFNQAILEVLTDPKVIHLQLQGSTMKAPNKAFGMVLLPMQNEAGQINRILGCVSTYGAHITAPMRFSVIGSKTKRIVSIPQEIRSSMPAGFADTPPAFAPRPANPNHQQPPVLRALDGNCQLDPARKRKARPNLRLVKTK